MNAATLTRDALIPRNPDSVDAGSWRWRSPLTRCC